ncbi:MAG: C_GCAxxG_C_C family protein [Theionarchaea archaeon]|nr:C_GCAxxG_C_C family protein [Theionarchaea archaeon]
MIDVKKIDREEVIRKAYEVAFGYERDIGNCPQCMLATMKDLFDIGGPDSFMSATGFAGGGGLTTEGTCGALVGGIMTLGLVFGRDQEGFLGGKKGLKAYKTARKLHERFVKEYGGPLCKDVQKKILGRSFNMWDRNDYQEFEKAGGHTDKCTDVVGKTAQWTVEILLNELEGTG